MEVVLGRSADEIVIVAWQELQAFGLRCERPEGDREVHSLIRVVTDRYHSRIRICYPTCFVLLFGHIVNDILLRVLVIRSWLVHRTYYVHLIVLERRVVLVHVYYMVCVVYSKYGIGGVPVHADRLCAIAHGRE